MIFQQILYFSQRPAGCYTVINYENVLTPAALIKKLGPGTRFIYISIDKGVEVSIRFIQVKGQQVGRHHATAGYAYDQIDVPGDNAQSFQNDFVEVGNVSVIHID